MTITVYSTSTCTTCHLLTDWLSKHNLAYTKKLADQDPAAMVEFMSVNDGHVGVPFSVVTNDEGQEAKIIGFDQTKFSQALGLV
jgi:glutaredoxin 3